MRSWMITSAVAAAALLAAGCDNAPEPRAKAPASASAGAGSSSQPVGERIPVPSAPTPRAGEQDKPDPGDANDHSTPRHDAKKKSSGD